jgi:hypothetical protein
MSVEVTAREKFSCPACGGEAEWNPSKQALVCPFCGTTAPAQEQLQHSSPAAMVEHDLVAALRSVPDDKRGWQAPKTSVKCQSCQAISVFDPSRVAQRCDFCGSSALVPYEEIKESFRPESLLPMKVSEDSVRSSIRQWYGSRWFAPNALKRRALTDTVKGLYIPYWTFDAQVHADWTAESGYYYYETETYRDSDGKTATRQVRKIRWQPSSGDLDHFFDDELVAATKGVHRDLLVHVEPFPTHELTTYQPEFLSGWVVERYQIDLVSAARAARDRMEGQTVQLCASRVPGDTHRNLQVRTHYTQQTFKHILVPIWMVTYNYGARVFQVVANGYTGAVAGEYPKSWIKIILAILALLAVIGLVVFIANSR